MLTSLAVNQSPEEMRLFIIDRSIPGTQWHTALENVCEFILRPCGFKTAFNRDNKVIPSILDNLIEELEQRQQLDETELIAQPSLFVFMSELDRVDQLRRNSDAYYSEETPLSSKIRRLYLEGPSKGIHLILSFSGIKPMSNVLDIRRSLPHFRHRVALQMSEDDSFTLVSDRQASRLQAEGPTPIKAIYVDTDSDRTTLFKPYSTEAIPEFKQQLQTIANQLIQRS